MSDSYFPINLPGISITISRSIIFSTKIQTSPSGVELRTSWWDNPKYSYNIKIEFLRQAGFSKQTLTDELQTLVNFYRLHHGKMESFLLVDPVDGVERRVRFDEDSLTLDRLFEMAYSCNTIKLISAN